MRIQGSSRPGIKGEDVYGAVMNQLTAVDILGYDFAETRIRGDAIVRVYSNMYTGEEVFSELVYQGTSAEDAADKLMKYWQSPTSWFISNRGKLVSL